AYRREVGCAVASGLHVIDVGEVCNLAQVRDAAAVYDGHTEVINELLGYEDMRVVNAAEYFAQGQWRGGVLADNAKALLQFSSDCVLKPEEMIRFERFAKPRRLNGRKPVMRVMQKMHIVAILDAQSLKQVWHVHQV